MAGLLFHVMVLIFCIIKSGEGKDCNKNIVVSRMGVYSSPGFYSSSGYESNLRCKIYLQAEAEDDRISVEFTDTNLPPEEPYGGCTDKVTVYNGPSHHSIRLQEVCGHDRPTLVSNERSLLLIFTTGSYNGRPRKGFRIKYNVYEEPEDPYDDDDSGGLSAGHIALMCLPSVLIYAVIGVVIYKRCKYAQRVRRNLAATGHTPQDLRMAMVSMMDQASRGPLIPPSQGNTQAGGGAVHSPRDVRQAMNSMMTQASQGPVSSRAATDPLQATLLHHMDQAASARHSKAAKKGGSKGRVRHPAGDIHHNGRSSPRPPIYTGGAAANYADEASYPLHPNAPYPSYNEATNNSNNNVLTNNNTAANLNYSQGGAHGRGYQYHPAPGSNADVYYAGDIDEHGVLHAPQDRRDDLRHSDHLHPSAPLPQHDSSGYNQPPVPQVHLPHLEDDQRSQGSSSSARRSRHRGGGGSGRNSPYADHHSLGRRSPHHHPPYPNPPQGQENNTLTYYGMIDNNQQASTDRNASVEDLGPPPSYSEVTGMGRRSPYSNE